MVWNITSGKFSKFQPTLSSTDRLIKLSLSLVLWMSSPGVFAPTLFSKIFGNLVCESCTSTPGNGSVPFVCKDCHYDSVGLLHLPLHALSSAFWKHFVWQGTCGALLLWCFYSQHFYHEDWILIVPCVKYPKKERSIDFNFPPRSFHRVKLTNISFCPKSSKSRCYTHTFILICLGLVFKLFSDLKLFFFQASGVHNLCAAARCVPDRPHLHSEDPLPHLWYPYQRWPRGPCTRSVRTSGHQRVPARWWGHHWPTPCRQLVY